MKLLNGRIFYYSTLIFAASLSLSHAAISFFTIWFVILFILQRQYNTTWKIIKNNSTLKIMMLFVGYIFLSLIWSSNTHEALNQIRLYSYWIIIPILAVSLKKEWLPNIITAFLAGMFVSEIISYGIFFEFWTINGRTPSYPAPFMTHIHYSIFLATTSVLLFSRILSNRYTLYSKIPIALFLITSTGNLLFSTGRIGQVALLVAFAVAIVIHYRFTFRPLFIFMTVSALLISVAYTSIDLFKQRADLAISDIQNLKNGHFETSWGERVAFWIIANDIIREHPFIGVGSGDYKLATINTLSKNNHGFEKNVINFCSSYDFHNQYLMLLVQGGIIGLALMIWLLIQLFQLKIEDPDLKEFSVLALTVFSVGCIAESLWILQFPIILFVFIVSVSLSASIQTNQDDA